MNVGSLNIDVLVTGMARMESDIKRMGASVSGVTDTMAKSAEIAKRALGAIGVGLSVGAAVASIRGVIDHLDEAGKAAQRMGFSGIDATEQFQYAAKLAGVQAGDFETAVGKLSQKMADAAGGGKESQAVFGALGIKVQEAGGKLRSTEEVIGDLAMKFASFRDGPEKTALAMDLFGKSGKQLIPLLNGGRDGLQQLGKEFGELAGIMGDDAAKAAEKFNDNLTRMGTLSSATGRSITKDLLPALNDVLSSLLLISRVEGGFMKFLLGDGSLKDTDNLSQSIGDTEAKLKNVQKMRKEIKGSFADGGVLRYLPVIGTVGDLAQLDNQEAALTGRLALLKKIDAAKMQGGINAAGSLEEAFNLGNSPNLKSGAPIVPKGDTAKGKDNTFDSLNASIEKHLRLAQEEQASDMQLSAGYKFMVEAIADVDAKCAKLSLAELLELDRKIQLTAAILDQNQLRKEEAQARKAIQEIAQREADAAIQKAQQMVETNQQLRDEIELIGLEGLARANVEKTRLRAMRSELEVQLIVARSNDLGQEKIDQLEREIRLLEQREVLVGKKAKAEDENTTRQTLLDEAKQRKQVLEDSITDGILNGFRRGHSLADVFLNELKAQFAKTLLRPIISPIAAAGDGIINSIFKGAASLFSDTTQLPTGDFARMDRLSGALAGGGPMNAGEPYLVGERGPEIVIPQSAGTVIPNNQIGGSSIVYAPQIHVDGTADAARNYAMMQQMLVQDRRQFVDQLVAQGVIRK